jgi:hypothetical protein
VSYSVDEKGKEVVTGDLEALVCAGCHGAIQGPYRTFSDRHWHPQCHPFAHKPDAKPWKERTLEEKIAALTPTAGRKDDSEKTRWDLLPWGPLSEVVDVLTYGAKKYAPDNWKHVPNPKSRYFAAALRHLVAWQEGQALDPESGKHHLAHAICCLLFALWFERGRP